ncbi:uncharacterized protein H6S33_008689 [Morchella sextelata]|uniref:uncharacterized protein n=1 Tax=Morchella sextelata TaxID=1174677 RepID=UPI001D041F72|nr:uncharacterized protein H6S33_008689 [Morchella sextelata]KAH0602608.1 hypothetical protein H6S33_008689 [Morchella sextelata]
MATAYRFPTFVLGVVVVGYLATFVFFAILRILTGVSIQRVGYFAFKRISYEPVNGVKIEVRKLGLLLHRPTFTQPTWISIVVSDSSLSVDFKKIEEGEDNESDESESQSRNRRGRKDTLRRESGAASGVPTQKNRSEIRGGTSKLKEKLKKLHKHLKWVQMVDIIFTNTTVNVHDVGSIQISSMTTMLDTRQKIDRNRMFDHCQDLKENQKPIEWMFTAKSMLFFHQKQKDPVELMDHCMFNVYGVLEEGADVIMDAAISIKFGKISLPFDQILECREKLQQIRRPKCKKSAKAKSPGVPLGTLMEELASPESQSEKFVEAVDESKKFLQSLLGSAFWKTSTSCNQKSPAHRMYFSPEDIAHQALLAAISLSVSVDDGIRQDKILYIPMVTVTTKTTLPSKFIQMSKKSIESDLNANMLFANMVITSPSIDLEPRHLPILLAFTQTKPRKSSSGAPGKPSFISNLLPKASINFSVHEPVIRISVFPTDSERKAAGNTDLLISSMSSISAVADSSYEAEGEKHYSLNGSFRITSHHLYYQGFSGEKHDLLQTDALDIRVLANAFPEIQVTAHAYLETFSLRLVRPEIVQGIKQMVGQFHRNVKPDKLHRSRTSDVPNFLRRLPAWIEHFKLEGKDFSMEIAGIDEEISGFTRGAALQLDSWSVEYRGRKVDDRYRPPPRRRITSRILTPDDTRGSKMPSVAALKNPTDGRKLTFNTKGLEGFMVDSEDSWEQVPFLNIPAFDISFSTSTDSEGPTLHISSHAKSFFFNYSLYRHYAVLVAMKVLKEAFGGSVRPEEGANRSTKFSDNFGAPLGGMEIDDSPLSDSFEHINLELKISHVRIKASMPDDPPMMLDMFGLDARRHKWSPPLLKAKHVRLYAESPNVKGTWTRLVSLRHLQVHLRQAIRKSGEDVMEQKSIDISADAIRLAIPHQLILYEVTDNIINTAKASQQMHHRFKTGTNDYILGKGAVKASKVPKISLRTKALLLELEDDPFETQLGIIYRLGLSEQKKRLAREAAFDAKVKKMKESERRRSWETSRNIQIPPKTANGGSSMFRGRSKTWKPDTNVRTESPDAPRPKSSHRGRTTPFSFEAHSGPSDEVRVSIEDAWERLQEHNSTAWIKRMRWAQDYHSSKTRESREAFYGRDEIPVDIDDSEIVLGLPMRPALMAGFLSDVELVIDKPSFAMEELPKFMHRVGKGLPENTQFALLVPISIKLDFSEARVLLRDYPLPLLHVPRVKASQSARLPAWSLKSDFVIGEELSGSESMRHCQVNIIPPSTGSGISEGGFAIDVRRTVAAVKSYSDFDISINTPYATRATWCTSYQPAIQDMMMVFETFTKPHFDPSERTGFWDKIRLVLHSHMSVSWKGDGDVQVTLKGSRDPYEIVGDGAGFVMCWRGDVRCEIGRSEDPREFLIVDSEEYLLAVPDFTNQVRNEFDTLAPVDNKSVHSLSTFESTAMFKKVIMKLSGKVRWMLGLMFEQEFKGADGLIKRSFEFKPHYDISLKTPQYAEAPPGEVYDAFRGFRSQHIHMSLSILSPLTHDWSSANTKPSTSYNTIHLTPRFFTHFFSWWGLFSGVMSLPIRQGPLWPGVEKSSKKFGRHLATIKYKLCLSPLFISHIYKHNDKDEAGHDVVAATGLKAKLDSFMVDIHQRREDIGQSTTMRINQAELDFHSADIRAVSAVIIGATAAELMDQAAAAEVPLNLAESTIRYSGDMSQFTIPDGDYSWIDMDDFVELDWVLPSNKTPKTKIMPLAYTPRFTYFRQTDHGDPDSRSGNECVSPFGHEPTHDCLMSENNDPREIQCGLVQARLEKVNQQIHKNKEALDSLAQSMKLNPDDTTLKQDSEKLIEQSSILFNKLNFLQTMLRRMSSKLDNGGIETPDLDGTEGSDTDSEMLGMENSPFDYISDFDNRFIVHNMQAKWNNSLRNIILKYIHQVSQRRGFVYYMSRRAVKFILDIVEEQKGTGKETSSGSTTGEYTGTGPSSTPGTQSDDELDARIKELLNSEEKFVVADEKPSGGRGMDQAAAKVHREDLTGDVAEEYVPQNSYHVRLIAPQIQMQSEKNKGAAVLVAAQGMQLKVVSIMDKYRIGDDVSGLVQRRFALNLENTQFFVSQRQDFAPHSMSLHSANRYGAPSGSSWPPWVPLESMFDFRNLPVGFSRVVERTSATLRYDKYNSLRLKYSDQVSDLETGNLNTRGGPIDEERRIDHVWVDFPRVEAACDSAQYFAMYIIVLDLLLYSEPLEKLRSEKLEKIMLASDFSDLTGAPEMVESLQTRIHQLEDIKTYFEINSRNLDLEGWEGRVSVDEDLASCEEELFFMMKAITTAQRKYDDRSSQATGILRWYLSASEIVWRLLREKQDPLMDIRLQNAGYERMDNNDGSNFNTVEVEMMRGYNLLPNAVYPVMIAPFFDQMRTMTEIRQTKILRVYWHMLEAIAGIPVMDHFEVNLFPLKIQLEREIGDKIFEYIFPGVGTGAFGDGGFSPFLVHSMKPIPDGSGSDDSDNEMENDSHTMDDSSSTKSDGTSPVDLRLKPTMSLDNKPELVRPASAGSLKPRSNSFKASSGGSIFRGFKPSRTLTHKTSNEAISVKSRKSLEGPVPTMPPLDKNSKKLQIFHRSTNDRGEKRSDELSQMMSRASNFMTLAYIKIPSVVLCLSYKGRDQSNIEDVHEFVFRMPMLEYRNKTWSNLDLAMRLKKDIIRALISHTGAILQNKLTHHRPSKPAPNLHRMMANNGSLGTSATFYNPEGDDSRDFTMSHRDTSTARPSTSYSFLKPPSIMRPGTAMSSMSSMSIKTMSTMGSAGSANTAEFYTPPTGATPLDMQDGPDDDKKNIFNNSLGRHLSNLAALSRQKDGIAGDSEESIKKKGMMLLGRFGGSGPS